MEQERKRTKQQLWSSLINTRKMTSAIDRQMALATNEIKRETVNWVPMWVDWGHSVRSDCATTTALRAITDSGELLWYVRHDTKKHGFHSAKADPFDAIDEGMDAWKMRSHVRKCWPQIEKLANDLIWGREKMSVSVEDAENSALCSLGIKWFRQRMRISGYPVISGRLAGLLMKVEPQMGFAIYEAALRQNKEVAAKPMRKLSPSLT